MTLSIEDADKRRKRPEFTEHRRASVIPPRRWYYGNPEIRRHMEAEVPKPSKPQGKR